MRQREVKNCAEYDVFTRINEHYAKMSKGHKAIADYISEHYDQAVFMTAAKLGETLGISESTVVRFAAGIGYDGYPKLSSGSPIPIHNNIAYTLRRVFLCKNNLIKYFTRR